MNLEINAELQDYLSEILKAEDTGFVEEALQAIDAMTKAYPLFQQELMYEKALMEFRNGKDFEALMDFIWLYQKGGNEEILSLIFEAYIEPNREEFAVRYAENRKQLNNYEYFWGETEEVNNTYVVWVDASNVVFFVESIKKFVHCENNVSDIGDYTEKTVLLYNPMFVDFILKYNQACVVAWSVNGRTIPIYLDFERNHLEAFLQVVDLNKLLALKRMVFLGDDVAIKNFFQRPMVKCPIAMIGSGVGYQHHVDIIKHIFDAKYEKMKQDTENAKAYYESHDKEILKNIKEHNCKIVFLVSRFTTVLQYHASNCVNAARKLGMEAKILIEQDDISHNDLYALMNEISDYKPDILFSMDHFRFQYGFPNLENMVVVSWIQDLIPNFMNSECLGKLTARDVLMTHLISCSRLEKLFQGRRMISAPIPANEEIYKPYVISDVEHGKYDCDICLVCHASDAENYMHEFADRFDQETKCLILHIYTEYLNVAFQGEILFSEAQFLQFIKKIIWRDFHAEVEDGTIAFIANDMYLWYNQRVYRQALVNWILEAGYEYIKLWGNGWLKSPQYAKYAMGPAQNGEELSKICQCSKIMLGNNIMTTAAARAWETMLSGGFYMSNYIPPDLDVCDIRKIIDPENFVMFYNKNDLIEKLHFYLGHEVERQQMADLGRRVSLKKMTFKNLMEHMMDEMPGILKDQIEG